MTAADRTPSTDYGARVLSLCDRSGVMVQPWVDAGYEATIVDIQHPAGVSVDGRLTRVGADLRTWMPPRTEYAIVFAFPPCTHLARSGARWWPSKGLRALIEGLELVERCREIAEWSGAPWMLENPVGSLSSYWRKPDHYFDPLDFAGHADDPESEAYTKKTCLWTGNGFQMPFVAPVEESNRPNPIHWAAPGEERMNVRSLTPQGFARAVFLANHRAMEGVA